MQNEEKLEVSWYGCASGEWSLSYIMCAGGKPRMVVMRYNQNGEITAFSPSYGLLILVMCIPATIYIVTNVIGATEWWQYAGAVIQVLALGVAVTWGIKSVRPAREQAH